MKKRELNLLPEKERFDFEKFFLLNKILIIFILNIFLLALITVNLILQNNILKNKISETKNIANQFNQLVSKLNPYKKEYDKVKLSLNNLDNKKKLYYINFKLEHSPLVDIIILNKSVTNGVQIDSLNYADGVFSITGNTMSAEYFYKFYETLGKNKFIKNIKFFYLKNNEKAETLSFKIDVYIKKI